MQFDFLFVLVPEGNMEGPPKQYSLEWAMAHGDMQNIAKPQRHGAARLQWFSQASLAYPPLWNSRHACPVSRPLNRDQRGSTGQIGLGNTETGSGYLWVFLSLSQIESEQILRGYTWMPSECHHSQSNPGVIQGHRPTVVNRISFSSILWSQSR